MRTKSGSCAPRTSKAYLISLTCILGTDTIIPLNTGSKALVIKSEETQRIAKLSKLNICESELPSYTDALSNILDMLEQLKTADTGKVDHLSIMPNINLMHLDDDNPCRHEDHTAIIQNFSQFFDTSTGEFLSPKVIDDAAS